MHLKTVSRCIRNFDTYWSCEIRTKLYEQQLNVMEIRRLQLSQLLLSHDHAIGIRTKDNIPPPLFKRLLNNITP